MQPAATAQLPSSPAAARLPPGAIAPPSSRPLFASQSHEAEMLVRVGAEVNRLLNDGDLGGPDGDRLSAAKGTCPQPWDRPADSRPSLLLLIFGLLAPWRTKEDTKLKMKAAGLTISAVLLLLLAAQAEAYTVQSQSKLQSASSVLALQLETPESYQHSFNVQ